MRSLWISFARAMVISSLFIAGVLGIHEIAKSDPHTQQASVKK